MVNPRKRFDLSKFESRINKFTAKAEADFQRVNKEFDRVASGFDKIDAVFNARLDKVIGLDSRSNDEVDRLLEQIQDEVRLDNSRKKLNDSLDQQLNDRINKLKGGPTRSGANTGITDQEIEERLKRLKEDSPIRSAANNTSKVGSTDKELADRFKKANTDGKNKEKPNITNHTIADVKKTPPKSMSFNDTINIARDTLDAQAVIAQSFADLSVNKQEAQSLTNLSSKLKEMSNIIDDTPDIPPEHKKSAAAVITKGLKAIYEGVKSFVSHPLDTIKELGNNLIETIKSSLSPSPEQQLKASKENLKGLSNAYAEIKGIKGNEKNEFLKIRNEKIDQIKSPQEAFKETYKITREIQKAGIEKINANREKMNKPKQKHNEQLKADRKNNLGNIPAPKTPNNKNNNQTKGPRR